MVTLFNVNSYAKTPIDLGVVNEQANWNASKTSLVDQMLQI